MRLSTHNLLECTNRCPQRGYPLRIRAASLKCEESHYDPYFTAAMVWKLDYAALLKALGEICQCPESARADAPRGGIPELPPALPADYATNEEFLRKLHVVLFELDVVDGTLVCPACGYEFPVEHGVPKMLLDHEAGGAVA
eukprot:TRINITY_DN6455_c0_g1_i1.p1 TRINITY_DN6455_c0_g1~~TRINITY_DN6455_c0_g1_i1.p1  ORF type:complete len:141 (+),score=14.45 TRINITY_DN6455_c0_g1_i1:158-580(+)